MIDKIDIIKGIHPGLIVDRELIKRKIRKSQFADTIDEHPQTLTAITKGKRRMNIPVNERGNLQEKAEIKRFYDQF